MFYTNERIIARYKEETDRVPEYVDLVDNALKSGEANIAMVGFIKPKHDTTFLDSVILIEDRYFIYLNPDIQVLLDHGFKFKNLDG